MAGALMGTPGESGERVHTVGWKELYLKEDGWAIWLGLGIIIVAYLFYISGSSIKWIAVKMGWIGAWPRSVPAVRSAGYPVRLLSPVRPVTQSTLSSR